MADKVLMVEHNGTKITYRPDYNRWEAEKGDRTFYGDQLSDVKKKLDLAAKAKIPRLKVLMTQYHDDPRVAEITGYKNYQPRVVWKDHRGDSRRAEVYESNLYDYSDENLKIFAAIKPLQEEQGKLQKQIETLQKKLSQEAVQQHGKTMRKRLAGESDE